MIKIGIITFYYKNYNYGGILQAYALEKFLNQQEFSNKYSAEQICYDPLAVKLPVLERIFRFLCRGSFRKKFEKIILRIIQRWFKQKKLLDITGQTLCCMDDFSNTMIKHSTRIYNENNYREFEYMYDVLICGSDQIWNPIAVRNAYLLKGIKKTKIAYGPSLAVECLKWPEKVKYKLALRNMNKISVREKSNQKELSKLLNKNVDVVVDPAFLLTKEHWYNLIKDEVLIKDKYVFVYSLGKLNPVFEQIIKKHKQDGGIIIAIAGVTDIDIDVDIHVHECSPIKFLSLINNAEFVITDSFHAVVFSIIYETKFLVANRIDAVSNMFGRIYDLLVLTDLTDACLTNNNNLDIHEVKYNFEYAYNKIERLKNDSIRFLLNAING